MRLLWLPFNDRYRKIKYGTYPSFHGGSSFCGTHVFQLKLYLITYRQVYRCLPPPLCKKNNKGLLNIFIDLNRNIGRCLQNAFIITSDSELFLKVTYFKDVRCLHLTFRNFWFLIC